MQAPVYLKPSFVAEPLVNRWYAWPHLLSPATACLNVKNRHIPILKSFIQDPDAHAAASRDPRMLGGPFVDCRPERVGEVKQLLLETVQQQSKLIAVATALEALDAMLVREARGYSLLPLYEKVPPLLRGYVELVYDLRGNPGFRVKEALLAHHPAMKGLRQSLCMYLAAGERPFALSTPRLDQPDRLRLDIAFANPALDALFRMSREPRPLAEIAALLGIQPRDEALFSSFFTTEAPAPRAGDASGKARVRYLGHACVLVETGEVSILFDPVTGPSTAPAATQEPAGSGHGRDPLGGTVLDLPERIDFVVLTHNHQDHVLLETLLQLRHRIGTVIVPRNSQGTLQDPSLKLMLEGIGFRRVMELDELGEVELPGGKLVGVPFLGEHGDLDVVCKLAYLLRLGDAQMLFLADSNNVEPALYEHVHALYGDVDALFIGMECDGAPLSWLYGAYSGRPVERDKDQSRRLSGSGFPAAWNLVERFRCKSVYVYALGLEPWVSHVSAVRFDPKANPIVQSDLLIEHCRKHGVHAERLHGGKTLFSLSGGRAAA